MMIDGVKITSVSARNALTESKKALARSVIEYFASGSVILDSYP